MVATSSSVAAEKDVMILLGFTTTGRRPDTDGWKANAGDAKDTDQKMAAADLIECIVERGGCDMFYDFELPPSLDAPLRCYHPVTTIADQAGKVSPVRSQVTNLCTRGVGCKTQVQNPSAKFATL